MELPLIGPGTDLEDATEITSTIVSGPVFMV